MKRQLPQGTFVVLAIIGIGIIAMAGYAVYGMVQISLHSIGVGDIQHEPLESVESNDAVGIGGLSIVAYRLIDAIITFGDRVWKWTRDMNGADEEEDVGS